MNNHDSKFSTGFMIGLLIGGGLVFLLGTKTGKNLLKIVSEQGLDGLLNLLEEYDLDDLIEVEEDEEVQEEPEAGDAKPNGVVKETAKAKEAYEEVIKEEAPKRRFFKRVRR